MKNDKKRILICLYYYTPYISGLTLYAKELAESLVKKGFSVTVFCSAHEKNSPRKEIINGVKVVRHSVLFSLGKGIFMPFFMLHIFLQRNKFDLINFHFPNLDLGLASLLVPAKKLFITYHCDINLGKGIINKVFQWLSFFCMNFGMKRAKTIIGNSKEYFLASKFKKFAYKFKQIYPPIQDQEKTQDKEELKIDKKIYEHVFKIGFVGRIVYEKGIDCLINALSYLTIPVHLFIVGDYKEVRGGSIYNKVVKNIERHKLTHKVTFLGKLSREQLMDFYDFIDVFVLPSIDPLESFGMVQVEALHFNVPLIATDMPGVNEVIKTTGYGVLSHKNDALDLSKKILEIYKNIEYYKQGKKDNIGKNMAEKYFSKEETINKYLDCFHG